MLSTARGIWSRHRRKILISLGVAGCGFLAYRFYDAHKRRIADLERQFQLSKEDEERDRMEEHFDIIQRVCDTKTLPNAMYYLRSRIDAELDLSYLKEKLMQGKSQTGALSKKEKLELWESLKISSFTRMACSLWSITMLSLFVRIIVNILGRNLYFEIASRGSSLEDGNSFSRPGQQDFLGSVDYLSSYGISSLIPKMRTAATEIVKDKQLNEPLTMDKLRETIMQILELFLSIDEPNSWINYILPQNAIEYKQQMNVSANSLGDPSKVEGATELEQMIHEARSVLSSPDFADVMDMSLKAVVNELIGDLAITLGVESSSIPLAKLLPQLGLPFLNELHCDKFVQAIQRLPEVDLFFKLLYANMPQVHL